MVAIQPPGPISSLTSKKPLDQCEQPPFTALDKRSCALRCHICLYPACHKLYHMAMGVVCDGKTGCVRTCLPSLSTSRGNASGNVAVHTGYSDVREGVVSEVHVTQR